MQGTRSAIAVCIALAVVGAGACSTAAADLDRPRAPVALTVDGLRTPIGIDPADVRFSWRLGDDSADARQTAYRIVVSHARTVVWDSGRVASDEQTSVPYGGPALVSATPYTWSVRTWDATGRPSRDSTTATFETGLRDRDWRASWIRRVTSDVPQYTYARKEFTLTRSPIVRARAYVSVDQQYELWLNGARAGKGEAYSYPDSQYSETLDVTSLVRAGARNAVGILSEWDGATKGHPAGAPGTIMQLTVLHRDGTTETITTDGSWRVAKGAWLPGRQRDLEGDIVDYTENIDGRAEPVGWDQPGFDDSRWAPATVIGPAGVAPWTHLVPVLTRIVEEPVRAVSVRTLPSGAVVADFGKVYAAVPTVTFRHGVGGRLVTMHAGYLLDPDGSVSTQHGTQHTDMSYSYIERGGVERGSVEQFHPFDYLGFRYLQIDDPGEPLARDDVVALTRHTAVPDEHAAAFASSSPTVDAVFELGRHSALFTAQEQFIDTPTREKGPWLWDGFNESQTAMAAFGEQDLTRKSLLEFAQSQVRYWSNGAVNKIYPTGLGGLDINEFTEIYPEWVWQYWLDTGDRTLLAHVYPALVGVARYVADSIDPSTGLVTNLPSTSVYYSFPVVTRLNVLGANVFARVAEVAAVLHRPAPELDAQRARRAALVHAINARLTRPDGIYVDGLNADGSQVAQTSQDTSACALVYGVVPDARRGAVGAYVASLGLTAPPRTAGEVLDALALTGQDAALVHVLTDRNADGWANILARGGTFTWEVWEPSDIIGDSMSHGWGANVLVEIQRALLGVRATDGGYGTFSVAPPSAGLAWARGRVPTPHGDIVVSWQRDARGGTRLRLTVPPGATAIVAGHAVGAGTHRLTVR
ncbi:MAG TPA: family 78 glycoside hydrolase catalytic domain [Acidimicrobiia bacterium]|nr:family 78 glycoside hydrolase catalytic domain [Acidimicrobiia bacterium]